MRRNESTTFAPSSSLSQIEQRWPVAGKASKVCRKDLQGFERGGRISASHS